MIPMLLYCPMCHTRHIDEGRFATDEHTTHACQNPRCGHVWRPAVEATVGVWTLPGFLNDDVPPAELAAAVPGPAAVGMRVERQDSTRLRGVVMYVSTDVVVIEPAHDWPQCPPARFAQWMRDDVIRILPPLTTTPALPEAAETWGVWCVGEGWCGGSRGTKAFAESQLPKWVSGEASDVDPGRFHYELRQDVAAAVATAWPVPLHVTPVVTKPWTAPLPVVHVHGTERDGRQNETLAWVRKTFGENVAQPHERAMRFIEEAVELAQACGLTADEVAKVAAHVFGKPVGDVAQEAGGVGLTLIALCESLDLSAEGEEVREWERVKGIDLEQFRRRHDAKAAAGIATRTDASVFPDHRVVPGIDSETSHTLRVGEVSYVHPAYLERERAERDALRAKVQTAVDHLKKYAAFCPPGAREAAHGAADMLQTAIEPPIVVRPEDVAVFTLVVDGHHVGCRRVRVHDSYHGGTCGDVQCVDDCHKSDATNRAKNNADRAFKKLEKEFNEACDGLNMQARRGDEYRALCAEIARRGLAECERLRSALIEIARPVEKLSSSLDVADVCDRLANIVERFQYVARGVLK